MLLDTFNYIKQHLKSTFNNHCMFCLEPSSHTICHLCLDCLTKLNTQCPRCAEPNHHGEVCGQCLKLPPCFDQVVCPFIYSGAIKKLIITFKAKPNAIGSHHLVKSLSEQLAEYSYDGIVPIPYHWKNLLARGHNPVRELTRLLSKDLNIKLIDGLIRDKYKPNQKSLKRKQRFRNLQGVFSVNIRVIEKAVRNKNILLVDDVLTTGATCNSAALSLKQAGAKSVTVACLARTPAKT
ncbi:MAG: ComF family protein [Psychrobacter glaciei]|jgi:ComF family protein